MFLYVQDRHAVNFVFIWVTLGEILDYKTILEFVDSIQLALSCIDTS